MGFRTLCPDRSTNPFVEIPLWKITQSLGESTFCMDSPHWPACNVNNTDGSSNSLVVPSSCFPKSPSILYTASNHIAWLLPGCRRASGSEQPLPPRTQTGKTKVLTELVKLPAESSHHRLTLRNSLGTPIYTRQRKREATVNISAPYLN